MRFCTPLVACLLALPALSCSQSKNPVGGDEGYQLVWSDEFEADGLPDARKWRYETGGSGWGNNELQYYTERDPDNARVENGRLVIEARKEEYQGKAYTSARLRTRGVGDWLYGKIEVEARLPSGRGTWPAIWMLPSQQSYGTTYWPDNGEIDIMEHVGYDPDVVHATVHTRAYYHSIGTQKGAQKTVPTARSDFHVYSIEWEPDSIRAFIDGTPYFTFRNERLTNPDATWQEWPFDKPFHLLLNLAVGGDWGGAQGVDPSIWPQRMEVEYVRVYQKKR